MAARPKNPETVYRGTEIPIDLRLGLARALTNAIQSMWEFGADMPVGAVALKNGRIVGEGFASDKRLKSPERHAEVQAVYDALDRNQDFDTVVTTLEPCDDCQDFLGVLPNISRVAYGLARAEASHRHLVKDHPGSAAMRVRDELGSPFEVIRLDEPHLRDIGGRILDNVRRDVPSGEVEVKVGTLLTDMFYLRSLERSLRAA